RTYGLTRQPGYVALRLEGRECDRDRDQWAVRVEVESYAVVGPAERLARLVAARDCMGRELDPDRVDALLEAWSRARPVGSWRPCSARVTVGPSRGWSALCVPPRAPSRAPAGSWGSRSRRSTTCAEPSPPCVRCFRPTRWAAPGLRLGPPRPGKLARFRGESAAAAERSVSYV